MTAAADQHQATQPPTPRADDKPLCPTCHNRRQVTMFWSERGRIGRVVSGLCKCPDCYGDLRKKQHG